VFVMGEGGPIWLQEELVSEGLARVYSFPDNRACIAELLTRESEARAKRLGVWGSLAYRIQSADDLDRLGRLTQSYQLVEGTVAEVGEGGGRIYLNFGDDWRSDFTISVERKDVPALGGRYRPQGACRQPGAGAWLDRMAQRADDRSHPPGAARAVT
jgi:Staphylococcal nuclease homologue